MDKRNINDLIRDVQAGKLGVPDLGYNPYEFRRIDVAARLGKLGITNGYCERAGPEGERVYRLWAEAGGKRYCFHSDSLNDAFDMLRDALHDRRD